MKKGLILTFSLLIIVIHLNAQDNYFAQWDENYTAINIDELLNAEQAYADSIETHYGDSMQFYLRVDKYRFPARFTGNIRKMSDERKSLMHYIFKMVGVDMQTTQIKNEVEIVTQDGTIWMPIQRQLEKPFKKEVSDKANVYLYTFFMNHHSKSKMLVNLFLISEFNTERERN